MHRSTVTKAVQVVINAICERRADFISMPTEQEALEIAAAFREMSDGIRGTTGLVDCTHVKIKRPGARIKDPATFYNGRYGNLIFFLP